MPTALISRAGNAAKAGSKKFSSAWSGTNHERPRDPGDLSRRNGAHLPHADAEYRLAGTVDLAVLRGVRRGDRLARRCHRRYQLWRIHHSRTGDAVAAYREHFQRLVRHLHADILRHDLQVAVRSGVVPLGWVGRASWWERVFHVGCI